MHTFQKGADHVDSTQNSNESENYSRTSEKDVTSCSGALNMNGVPGVLRVL